MSFILFGGYSYAIILIAYVFTAYSIIAAYSTIVTLPPKWPVLEALPRL